MDILVGENADAAEMIHKQSARILTDYRNADGRFPDGFIKGAADDTDDTHSLRTALDEGPGVVFVLGETESRVHTDAMLDGFLVTAETAAKYGRYENGRLNYD